MSEWIDIEELAKREGLTEASIRRMVTRRLLSFRRRGPGKRAALQFDHPVVHRELARVLGREGKVRQAETAEAPTIFTVLTEVRELRATVSALSRQFAQQTNELKAVLERT